jgi:hypothetical protein
MNNIYEYMSNILWELNGISYAIESSDSSVGTDLGYGLFYSWRVLGTFLFTTASRKALGPTQPPI